MRLLRFRRGVLAFLAVFGLVYMAVVLHHVGKSLPAMVELTNLPVIVIDPGHGGVDGGAVGADGTVEKDINLHIGLILRDMFLVNGFDVIMTRDTDISIHDADVTGVRRQKTSDLRNRLAIVKDNPGCILISIHQNKFSDTRSNGTQVFYGSKNAQSEKLAGIVQASFVRNLQPHNKRQPKQAGKNLYLMYEAKDTAILVECGFLSNKAEREMLKDPQYQSKIAFTTFCAVMEFLELQSQEEPEASEPVSIAQSAS